MVIIFVVALAVTHYCVEKDLFVHVRLKSTGCAETKVYAETALNEYSDEFNPSIYVKCH